MSSPVITIKADKRLMVVDEIMRGNGIKHLPVVDIANTVIGIISHRDMMEASVTSLAVKIATAERRQHLAAGTVEQVMKRDVVTIAPDETIQHAAKLMREHGIGCLPVVDDKKLVGILTIVDLAHVVEQLPAEMAFDSLVQVE